MNYLLVGVGGVCIDKATCAIAWAIIIASVIALITTMALIRIFKPDWIFLPKPKSKSKK